MASSAPPLSLLGKSLSSARSLVLLQLLSRALTFSLNHALLRFASPEVFGTASIQFDLIGSTLLFLSREGIRGALLRSGRPLSDQEPSSSDDSKAGGSNIPNASRTRDEQTQLRKQQDLNLSLLPLPLFVGLATVILPLYIYSSPPSTLSQPYFYLSLSLHVFAYLLELLCEPYYIRLQTDLKLNVRVQAEGAAVIAKAGITLLAVWCMRDDGPLLGFGLGQLTYGAVLLARFGAEFGCRAWRMWIPVKQADKGTPSSTTLLESESYGLAKAMTQQSLVKHFLTEGDRIIVGRVSPLKDQGGYAVATNYGSLVARIIFQPLEETARLYFSKSIPSHASNSSTSGLPDDISTGLTLLTTLLRFSTHLLVLIPAFGPPFIPVVLSFLLPSSKWSPTKLQTPSKILKVYTLYLPLMSLNGMLEAFFAATATPKELARQSRAMVGFSVLFLLAAGMFAHVLDSPEVGLLWANCVNMICRIGFTMGHVRVWFGDRGALLRARDVAPSLTVLISLGVMAVLVRTSEVVYQAGFGGMRNLARHVGIGGALGGLALAICWRAERPGLRLASEALRRKKDA